MLCLCIPCAGRIAEDRANCELIAREDVALQQVGGLHNAAYPPVCLPVCFLPSQRCACCLCVGLQWVRKAAKQQQTAQLMETLLRTTSPSATSTLVCVQLVLMALSEHPVVVLQACKTLSHLAACSAATVKKLVAHDVLSAVTSLMVSTNQVRCTVPPLFEGFNPRPASPKT